jgi:hypothetical protein
MEMITHDVLKRTTSTTAATASAANDNQGRRKDRRLTPSSFPRDTVARIFRPARSAMTSGKARNKGWQLVFERRSAPYVEPLMGWTADDDPLATVELSFPTLGAAAGYAERQGLPYIVQTSEEQSPGQLSASSRKMKQGFADETLERLGLGFLQDCYDKAVAGAEALHDRRGEEVWTSPMAVCAMRAFRWRRNARS